MDETHSNSNEPIQFETGKENSITFNRPVKFEIHFNSGTYIKGTVPANEPFVMRFEEGDVKRFDINIDDDSFTPLHIV